MSETEVARLLEAIEKLAAPRIPMSEDLWRLDEIAAYLKRSKSQVRDRVTALPGFPQAIRLPASKSGGEAQPLWEAREIIAWAKKYKEHRRA